MRLKGEMSVFFSDWETREGDGQQQRGWRVKGDWRKVKWKVKGKWRLGDKQWTSLAFTAASFHSPGRQQLAKCQWVPHTAMEAALSQLVESDGFCPGLTCATSWSIVWRWACSHLDSDREAALSSSGWINVYLQRCSVLITSSLFH